MSTNCPQCGKVLNDKATICPNCKTKIYAKPEGTSEQSSSAYNYKTNPMPSSATMPANYGPPVSFGAWLGLGILMLIPVVNLIVAFILMFNKKQKSISNFGKAAFLIMIVLLIAFVVLLFVKPEILTGITDWCGNIIKSIGEAAPSVSGSGV